MDALYIITVYVLLDEWHRSYVGEVKYHPKMSPAEVALVAVVAAKYFRNNHERALLMLRDSGYIPRERSLSVSRFNRQLHRQGDWLDSCLATLMELTCEEGELFVIDSEPIPVCRRVRARRCRKVRGAEYCGYCSAKRERYFGWKLFMICSAEGIPVAYHLLPAAWHDLTPIYELSYLLPVGSSLLGDKAFNDQAAEQLLAAEGVELVPIRKKNMKRQHGWAQEYDLRTFRRTIEVLNSQTASMGLQQLHARTNEGFFLKLLASIFALFVTRWTASLN